MFIIEDWDMRGKWGNGKCKDYFQFYHFNGSRTNTCDIRDFARLNGHCKNIGGIRFMAGIDLGDGDRDGVIRGYRGFKIRIQHILQVDGFHPV